MDLVTVVYMKRKNSLNALICSELLFVCATETAELIQLKCGSGGSALKLSNKHYYSFE
jgi:hypothetical protein